MTRIDENELSRPPQEVLEILSKLGKGSYGSVFKARIKADNSIVAVKKVPVDSDLSDIVKEISIMQQCDNPHIVKCYGSLFDNQDLWICMEYCGAGSVADIMRLREKSLNEDEIMTILKFSLLGLEYLHKMRKIHRDIKAGNILLTENGRAKLADFGVAGQLSDTLSKRNTVIGTPYWMAPEVIQEIGYNCSADIWSLGITSIEMADKKPPLGDVHPMRALFMIASEPPPQLKKPLMWSDQFRNFIQMCLSKSPEDRPTASELLNTDCIASAKSHCSLIPLIKDAQCIREKRSLEMPKNKQNLNCLNSSGLMCPTDCKDASAEGDTMIRHSTNEQNDALSNTLISNSSSSERGGCNSYNSQRQSSLVGTEGQGTMVINASITEGVDLTAPEQHAQQQQSAANGQMGAYAGTLTHSDMAAAGAVAAAQRACGLSGQANAGRRSGGGSGLRSNQGGAAAAPAPNKQRHFPPISRSLRENGLQPGAFNHKSYAELEAELALIDHDLETELRNLTIRYEHKRQPLVDAITSKSIHQHHHQHHMHSGHQVA